MKYCPDTNLTHSRHVAIAVAFWCSLVVISTSKAQNPFGVYSPVHLNSDLPYRVVLKPYSMPDVDVPTLHSYAAGYFDGKWMFVSGRTNGLHGFDFFDGESNFPAQYQNRDIWVVDVASKQTWSRSMDDPSSGLSEAQKLSLSTTNNQFHAQDDTLYITGGYGIFEDGGFGTHDTLSAIDMPGLADWVMNGNGAATDHIRQIHHPMAQVTGGAMYELGGKTRIVFGQDFQGVYLPFSEGTYTEQIRSFDIVDDGVNLSIENATATTPDPYHHRRDLNVVPVIRDNGVSLEPGLNVLSGVFTPAGDPWSVPVEIDANGTPTVADPFDPNTFQQGMNNYHSAKLGLYSRSSGEMHQILFGGISLQYLNPATQMIEEDINLPFVNDITSIVVGADGEFSQHHSGFFPELFDTQGRQIRLGTNSEFLPIEGLPAFENGVFDFDMLSGETTLGYIYGGIIASAPHVRGNPGQLSSASNHFFEVVLIRVPEPSGLALLVAGIIISGIRHRNRQACPTAR